MLNGVYLVVLASLAFYIGVMVNCGRMRVRHNIPAPATLGHPEFERAFRVQMNTLEHLVPFLAAILLCAFLTSAGLALTLGVAWLIGRIWYAFSYMSAADRRGPGFLIAFAALNLMIVAAAYGAIQAMLAGG
ncbi:MAG: MAPEG family protein [Elsteraceae bacterium]